MKKPLKQKPCWEIMQCKTSENCAARQQKDTACWEAARQQNDYRAALNICQDCIVYLLGQENTALTKLEIDRIMHTRETCNMG